MVYPVAMLNCDVVSDEKVAPRIWERVGEFPARLPLKHDITERDVIRENKVGEGDGKVEIVAPGGAAHPRATCTISLADLVPVQVRPSPLDASAAEHIPQLTYINEETFGRRTSWAAAITAAKNIRSQHHKKILADLQDAEPRIIEAELTERGRDIFARVPTSTHDGAIENAQQFTRFLLDHLAKVPA